VTVTSPPRVRYPYAGRSRVAQSAERPAVNRQVPSSSLGAGALPGVLLGQAPGLILKSPRSHRLLPTAALASVRWQLRWQPGRRCNGSRGTDSDTCHERALGGPPSPSPGDRAGRAAGTSRLPRATQPMLWTSLRTLRSASVKDRCGRTQDPRSLHIARTCHPASRPTSHLY
jgi:hypothetical protein